ncbi:Intermediate filament protein [Mortierella sp. GBA43]|nr:Intermediate filament protein [Mortierella sp. GBA43]
MTSLGTHNPPTASREQLHLDHTLENYAWFLRPLRSKSAATKVGAVLVLVLVWAIGNSTLRRIATFILATPVVLVLSLLTLAVSNVAFSFFYTRRQRQQTKTNQRKKNNPSRTLPGTASRLMFHYLRPAKFTRPAAWSAIEKQRRQEQAAKYRMPIADTMPQFSEAVDTLIELILRDYIAGWMRAITPEVVLQQRLEEILRVVLIRLKTRVMDLDLTQLLVTKLVPKVTEHVDDFRKAEIALRGNTLERSLTETDELDLLVASKFRGGKLHKALSTSISTQTTEEAYLRNVVQTVLPTLLPKSEVQSEILRHLLREILVCAILRPVMDLLSDPDYWNQNVDYYIGNAIREQNMVKKLREVLKHHAANMDSEPVTTSSALDPYGNGDLLEFEEFMRMIKQCTSLLDLKQIRNAILTQIRKKRALIAGRERDDIVKGHKVEDVIVYINKLELARRRAEKQIEALGGPAYPKRRNRDHTPESKNTTSFNNFESIITNSTGISYFMEFLDQRESMNELQFWLLVETLDIKGEKRSAEADASESWSGDERASMEKSGSTTPSSTSSKAPSQKTLGAFTPVSANTTTGSSKSDLMSSSRSSRRTSIATTTEVTDALREDVRGIYEMYFAESAPRPIVVDHSLVDVFRAYALSDGSSGRADSISDTDSRKHEDPETANVRKKLVEAQRQVFEQMLQKDYPEFVKSDIYFKFLTSDQNSTADHNGDMESGRGHGRTSSSGQRGSAGPTLLSAIGLSPTDRRREVSEGQKRSSGGSFLEIFGLGRDKERERSPMKRAETSTGPFRSGFLSPNPNRARSNTASPVSIRTVDSEDRPQLRTKKSLEVESRHITVPLARARSLSAMPNIEIPVNKDSRTKPTLTNRNSTSTMGDDQDFADSEAFNRSGAGEDSPALQDSLLMELQEEDEDDGSMGDSQMGLPIPRMSKDKRGKEKVIDAVEAALSSIMESPDIQQEDLSGSGLKESGSNSPSVDLTDPAFSTARDKHAGVDALLEWGESQRASKKRSKGGALEKQGPTVVQSRGSSQAERGSQKQTQSSSSSGAQGSTDGNRVPSHFKTISDMSDDSNDDILQGIKGKEPTPSIADTIDPYSDTVQDSVHLAAPGDLLLSDRIKRLEKDIKTAREHEDIVESMIQKAERQGRENELRILKKSKSALRREILIMEYQKTQYEVQEEENMIMPGRTSINITSSTVGHEGSKEFALYEIEVHQLAKDGSFASGWVIARRYSEFFALHQQLKEKFPSIVRQIDFPGKRGFLKLQKSFVEGRRIGLERYLRNLLHHVDVCQSQELKAFLSQENVAPPQLSLSTPNIMPYNLFDNDDNKDDKQTGVAPPSSQLFFEQIFHSSPLQSPVTGRNLLRGPSPFQTSSDNVDAGTRGAEGATGSGESEGFMRHIYQTVSDGIDDMFSGGPPTVLGNITKQLGNQVMQFTMEKDEIDGRSMSSSASFTRRRHGSYSDCDTVRMIQSEIIDRTGGEPQTSFDIRSAPRISFSGDTVQRPDLQRIHSARSRRLSSPDPHTHHQRFQHQLQQQEQEQQLFQREQQAQHSHQAQAQPPLQEHPVRQDVVESEGVTTFTEPLCDLFIELFELKKNNWLRRQAVVIMLQQVLGGTIERKLRDTVKSYFQFVTEDLGLSSTLPQPPAGVSPSEKTVSSSPSSTSVKKPVRTAEQRAATKDQANRKLSAYLPDLLGSMVGHQNARRGARRVFAAFQNRRLNQQLVYTTLDEVITAMWPEMELPSSLPLSGAGVGVGVGATSLLASPTGVSASTFAASKSSATKSSSSSGLPPNAILSSTTDSSDSRERPTRLRPGRSKR